MSETILYDFELTRIHYEILFIPIILILTGIYSARLIKKFGFQHSFKSYVKFDTFARFFSFLLAGFGFIVFVVIIVQLTTQTIEKNVLKKAIRNDSVEIVEGQIENFIPEDNYLRDYESFEVNGINFKYSTNDNFLGYKKTSSHNGVIKKNGQSLKITFYKKKNKNIILKIEEKNY